MPPLSVCRDIASAIKEVLDAVNEVSKKHQTDTRMKEYKKVRVQLELPWVCEVLANIRTSSAVGNTVDSGITSGMWLQVVRHVTYCWAKLTDTQMDRLDM